MIYIYKLKYLNKETAITDLIVKGVYIQTDEGLFYNQGIQAVVEIGLIVLIEATYDENGNEITPPIFDDGYYFALQANKRDELNNRISIAIGTINLQLQQGFTYNLFENSEGNATGLYSYATNHNYTSTTNFGELTITKLDEVNHIVSGTFWFDVQDTNGVIHQIRDGRFDMQYTN